MRVLYLKNARAALQRFAKPGGEHRGVAKVKECILGVFWFSFFSKLKITGRV